MQNRINQNRLRTAPHRNSLAVHLYRQMWRYSQTHRILSDQHTLHTTTHTTPATIRQIHYRETPAWVMEWARERERENGRRITHTHTLLWQQLWSSHTPLHYTGFTSVVSAHAYNNCVHDRGYIIFFFLWWQNKYRKYWICSFKNIH